MIKKNHLRHPCFLAQSCVLLTTALEAIKHSGLDNYLKNIQFCHLIHTNMCLPDHLFAKKHISSYNYMICELTLFAYSNTYIASRKNRFEFVG